MSKFNLFDTLHSRDELRWFPTLFWSPLYGDMYFQSFLEYRRLQFKVLDGDEVVFDEFGRPVDFPNSELMIFPNKRQQDWSKWSDKIPLRWRGDEGDIYYYIDEVGTIREDTEMDTTKDQTRWMICNYFQTKEIARSTPLFQSYQVLLSAMDRHQKSEE